MSRKFLILFGMTIGSIAGSYVPLLWGADLFSFSSIIGSGIGGLLGIWVMFKLTGGLS